MSGDRLTHEQRQGQVITKLKKGIAKRDLIIKELRNEVKELRSKLEDVSYQFEQLKTIIFKKKGVIKRTLDDDNEKPPKVTRTKESYTRVIPQEGEITAIITHTRDDISYSKTRERIYYIEDIPLDTKKTVEKHIVTEYLCSGTWIPASVLPSKKVILGDTIRMMVITLHTEQRLSYSQIVSLLQLLYQLTISEGEIAHILHSEAQKLELTSQAILESIQSEDYHHIDETGWRVKGEKKLCLEYYRIIR
jgi:hypothetical protein